MTANPIEANLQKFEYIQFGMMQPVAPDFKVDNFHANCQGKYTFFLSHNHEGKLNDHDV